VEREGSILLAFSLVCVAGLAGISPGKYKLLISKFPTCQKFGYVHIYAIDWGYESVFCKYYSSIFNISFTCSDLGLVLSAYFGTEDAAMQAAIGLVYPLYITGGM